MTSDLSEYVREMRSRVNRHLERALQALAEEAAPMDRCPPALLDALRYSLLAPGKRLRPLLVILAAEASGGGAEAALPAAAAVEMIHTYSLIHDDLPAMDDDDLRRGRPTCHKVYGEAMAILAGDALLTLAFQVLAAGYPPATAAGCCLELARGAGAAGMVGGQVLDLEWEKKGEGRLADAEQATRGTPSPATLQELDNLHARKTGALFRACMRLGVWVAQGEQPGGPDPALLRRLDEYGRCFGQAFQITDDLLDVEGHTAQTGKRVGKDAVRGKLTYPGFVGVADSHRRAERLVAEAREQLAPLGPEGDRLAQLAQFILLRTH